MTDPSLHTPPTHYLVRYMEDTKQFAWTKSADKILASVERSSLRISNTTLGPRHATEPTNATGASEDRSKVKAIL